ncbi:MAG: 2'-5' RNA ligase family protein [Drouetiella hepatica Uher 2000/2452]|jgi:2'-5' RNA ligase|uniref:2'-5' RNA ligase family protein n=1 Tax=Drouetiella hepatica Uher 2000/2452 TaxID=904376 RepID=A0A951QDK0_9CYAN|nr:2'-5' RNA ligase family protein [Drouetiella hepatica Uher 2000/2452]
MASVAPDEARFFIALIPPIEIQNYANSVIQELGDRYHTRTSPSPPHITLQAPFLWQMTNLSRLESCLSQFTQNQSAVPVKLSGFGSFAPRVLYINVLKTPELLALQARLMAQLETHGIFDPIVQHRAFSPHITLASRNLTLATFQQAWSELQLRQVEFEYVSDRLTLLLHDGQRWQIRSQFLMNARF